MQVLNDLMPHLAQKSILQDLRVLASSYHLPSLAKYSCKIRFMGRQSESVGGRHGPFHSGPDFIEIDINFKKKILGDPARYPIQGYSEI